MRRALVLLAAMVATTLALTGCSAGKPGVTGPGTTPAALITDFGVTQADITLGVLTDYAGPFSDTNLGVLHGQQLWVSETNAAGGICGRKIQLLIRDQRGNAAQLRSQYAELEPHVLGFAQIVGGSLGSTLTQTISDSETTVFPVSRSAELLTNPYLIIPAATYDIEMINGLSYLLQQGRVRDGDTIGFVWLDADAGANALRGVQYFAQHHHLVVREAKITPTSGDIRKIMAGFAAEPRVRAIALSTTPAQTAALAELNQRLGLKVPLVGTSSVFTPQLLSGPSPSALAALSVVSSSVPFASDVPAARHVADSYRHAGYPELPSSAVPYGYAIGQIWGQLLRRACLNHDMSRSGVQEALHQLTRITTDHLIADLDFTTPGAPATRETSVNVPDPVLPGGLRQVTPLFMAPEAKSYVPPHARGD